MDSSNSDVVAQACGTAQVVLQHITPRERRLILEAAIAQCKPLKYFPGFVPLHRILNEYPRKTPEEAICIESHLHLITGEDKFFVFGDLHDPLGLSSQEQESRRRQLAFDQKGELYLFDIQTDPEFSIGEVVIKFLIQSLDESALEALLAVSPSTLTKILSILEESAKEEAQRRKTRSEQADGIARALEGMCKRCRTYP